MTPLARTLRSMQSDDSARQGSPADDAATDLGLERDRRAGLTTVSAVSARAVSIAVSLMTVPLVLNYLGVERYGMWLTISSIVTLLAASDLGVGSGLLNRVTRNLAVGDDRASRVQISSAFALLSLLAGIVGLVFLLAYPFLSWGEVLAVKSSVAAAEAGPAMAIMVVIFLLGLPTSVVTQVRLARQEGYVVHLAAAAGNLVALAAVIVAVNTAAGLPVLVLALTGPLLVAVVGNGWLLFRRHAPEVRPSMRLANRRDALGLLQSGSLFFVIAVSMAVAFASDTIVVAHLIGPEAVAEYGIAYRLFVIPTVLVAAILSPLWPAYGDAIARKDADWVRRTLRRSIIGAVAIATSLAFLLVVAGQPIVDFWVQGSVAPSLGLLLGFGIWTIMSACGMAVAMFLNGANEIRLQAIAAAAMAGANILLSIWLTQRIGVSGVVWGTVIAYGALVLVPMALYAPGVVRRVASGATRDGSGGVQGSDA